MPKPKPMQLNPEMLEALSNHVFFGNTTFKELRGFTDDEMEAMYSAAYSYYNYGKFEESKDIFALLTQLDHFEPRYFMGLGAARQMLQDYKGALEAYAAAAILVPEDVRPSFHAHECFMKLKNLQAAKDALLAAQSALKLNPQGFEDFAPKIEEGLKRLEKI